MFFFSPLLMPERSWSRKPCMLASFLSLPPTCASQTHIRHTPAEALTARLSNKKAQSVAGVGPCYVTSLPRGANLADMGWIGHTQLPSERVLYIFNNTDSRGQDGGLDRVFCLFGSGGGVGAVSSLSLSAVLSCLAALC